MSSGANKIRGSEEVRVYCNNEHWEFKNNTTVSNVFVVVVFGNNCIQVNAVLCDIQTLTAILFVMHGICF